MSDETMKEIMKLCEDSYRQGGKDMKECLVEGLRITLQLYPNITAEELIQAIKGFDYAKKHVRLN